MRVASAWSRRSWWMLFAAAVLGTFCGAGCSRGPTPEETIKRAYSWYVETSRSGQDPWQRARSDLQQLVTERFLASIENMRADLDGGDLMEGRNFDARLTVNDVTVKGSAATAQVALAGRMIGRQRLNVYLVREDRRWKIDDVKLVETD